MAGYLFGIIAVVVIASVLVVRWRQIDTTRFMAMPSTRLGRVSAWLLVAALVLTVVSMAVLGDALPSIGKVNTGPLVGVLVMVAALVTGVVAMIRDRERSWAVWLAVALPLVVVGAEVLSLIIGGD
jgi:cytochrome bd-type quinol oxidase subunit 2